MKSVGVFDILGPVMVGPSSSHTAGAARLGKVARAVAGGDIEEVTFYLHGSFAKTYKGHGTDRMGLKIHFKEADLGDVHPNTVEFVIKGKEGTYELIGSSIGGGSIEVTSVNRNTVNFTGAYPTIIVSNKDVPGVVSKVTSILYDNDINIAFMKVFRNQKGKDATMVFEVDHEVTSEIIGNLKAIEGINKVIMINPIKDGE